MIILYTLAVWYLTKIYYTNKFTINVKNEDGENINILCNSCGRTYWIHRENLRSPYYCHMCK